jgi:hypothetical protein
MSACFGARAQIATPPKPIPAPPIPAPPQIGPPPPITPGTLTAPPPPVITIPDTPNMEPIAIPPQAAMTAADPTDTTRPPVSGALTGPTAMVSPGANGTAIDRIAFPIDPNTTEMPAAVDARLRDIARSLTQNPAARIEVRVFSPSKLSNSQSNARRLSLARYVAIRRVLTDAGVADRRIDGRPLVSEPNELNPDRVELYIEH